MLGVYEGYKLRLKDSILGVQFLFVAFGALVLMPILTGLDPSVALFTSGVGTIIFQIFTRKRVVPIFLASSFAFIAPISLAISKWGLASAMGGVFFAGLAYAGFSYIIKYKGIEFVNKYLPPIVVGPVIMCIGLILAHSAVSMAMASDENVMKAYNALNPNFTSNDAMFIAFISLATTLICIMFAKGFFKLIPILCGIAVGYGFSCIYGIVDFSKISNAPWFAIPHFTFINFNLDAIFFMVPVIVAPIIEHIGNVIAISNVTGEDFTKNPGLDKTLLGDGVATSVAALMGGTPCTTYAEVTGAVRLTKAYNPAIMTFSAITAIILAFIGKIGAFMATIPACVLGGIMILLFGIIASVGIESLIKDKTDMEDPRNLVILALILVPTLGGMSLSIGFLNFKEIGLGAIIGIILNIILPKSKKDDTIN